MRYDYECQNEECQFLFEIEQKVTDKKRFRKCPMCKKYTLERVLFEVPLGFVKQDPATVLQQAEHNTKKMGKYELEDKRKQLKDDEVAKKQSCRDAVKKKYPGAKIPDVSMNRPWYGNLPDKMKGQDNKRLHKYIMEGK